MTRPRIAVFSGPTATICNSPPLITSMQARKRHGLPQPLVTDEASPRFDVLRPQRLAAPVTVYIEAFSAHPLEADAAELYAPPDGWLDVDGAFCDQEPETGGTPVYVAELRPEDGLLPLPYMARQADGSAWEDVTTSPLAPAAASRQAYYPDASRIYEEIDRLAVGRDGRPVPLSAVADFDFYRAAPPGGYTKGLAASRRTDVGSGDVPPEVLGEDYFIYNPRHLFREPTLGALARATNLVQSTLDTGKYLGAQWLEGSPTTEETMYWLGLVIDTELPLVGHSAQRMHQALGSDGDRNILDGVSYIASGAALDERGRDRLGAVMIIDELVYAAREVTKVDARPGGYEVTGGHGGIVAALGGGRAAGPLVTFVPSKRHTYCSDVRLSLLPSSVLTVAGSLEGGLREVVTTTKDDSGGLVPQAMPVVTIGKFSRYSPHQTAGSAEPDPMLEVEIIARIRVNLETARLSGIVHEGFSPYGFTDSTTDAALKLAVFAGMPVVQVGRGNTGGRAYKDSPFFIAGSNLTSTKARILLMAVLLRFGSLPPAANPFRPTPDECQRTEQAVARFQEIFDTH
jgi:L-asparaginase